MRTVSGRTFRITATSGFRTSLRAGLRIAMAIGFTSRTTGGPGSATSRGDGLPITTAVGSGTATRGRGGRVRFGVGTVRSGRRRMFPSGDGAGASALVSVLAGAAGAALAGCRLDPATGSIRGGVDIADVSAGLDMDGMADIGVDSVRYMAEHGSRTSRTSTTPTSITECRPWVRDDLAQAG